MPKFATPINGATVLRASTNEITGPLDTVEKLTNGEFTSNLTGWTQGTGWVWSATAGGSAKHNPGAIAALSQTVTGLTIGAAYLAVVTVSGTPAGTYTISLGTNTSLTQTATASIALTAPTASATFAINASTTTFDGLITSVSLRLILPSKPQIYLDYPFGTSQAEVRAAPNMLGIGAGAGARNQTSTASTAFGNQALAQAGAVTNSTAVGHLALSGSTTGSDNTAVGYRALAANMKGLNNTALGSGALSQGVGAEACVAIGTNALIKCEDNHTVAIGHGCLAEMTGGGTTVAIGSGAFGALTTGLSNVAIGYTAGNTGSQKTTTGSRQTMIGAYAGPSTATQVDDVVVVGYQGAAKGTMAIGIGSGANANGVNSIAIGGGATASGSGSVAIGRDSAGTAATTSATDEIMLGTSSHVVKVPGPLSLTGQVRGTFTLADALNISVGTTTGTKIATTATQKLGFWNATPVVRNGGWVPAAGYTVQKTFDPETGTATDALRVLGTLIDALKTYGLLA